MFERITKSITPFALMLVLLAGASLTGWVNFSNQYVVGVATVFAGIILVIAHVAEQVKAK
jgi:hypothetical protein